MPASDGHIPPPEPLVWPARVFLTGYMGAGKSTVGRLLAQKLAYRFVDTDQQLVRQFHKPVSKIFEDEGEAVFRQAEADLVRELLGERAVVVSTGGGTLTREETLAAVRSQPDTLLVYLEAPIETLYERVIFSRKERPLLNVPNSETVFRERFEARRGYYEQAHCRVQTSARRLEGPEGLLETILQQLQVYRDGGA